MGIKIIGSGRYIPPLFEKTEEVAKRLGIESDNIVKKTGIEKRHLAGDETASGMGHKALLEAIELGRLDKSDIDGVIVATFTGDYLYPNTALKLVKTLGLNCGIAQDVMANCAGMQVAFENARSLLIANDKLKFIAVVGIAKQSPFVDPNDENSAYFFGDAASAVIMGKDLSPADSGFLPSYFKSNTKNYELVRLRAGGSSFPFSPKLLETNKPTLFYEHTGLGVWKEVVVELPKIIRNSLDDLGWTVDEVDLVLFHQANLNLINYCMAKLKVPKSKTINNVQALGNTAEASLGTVIYEAFKKGMFSKGKKILFASVGAGFIYAVTPYYEK